MSLLQCYCWCRISAAWIFDGLHIALVFLVTFKFVVLKQLLDNLSFSIWTLDMLELITELVHCQKLA